MAGNYPDVPDHRMAIDRDGTTLSRIDHNASTVTALGGLATMNAEHGNGVTIYSANSGNFSGLLIFPELRDIKGVYHGVMTSSNGGTVTNQGFQWSPNTTNGLDGTWTSLGAFPYVWQNGNQGTNQIETDKQWFRENITPYNLTGVKAVRWRMNFGTGGGMQFRIRGHLYGQPTAGQAPNRLRFWHPTLDQEIPGAYFDFGDVARNTVLDKTFRVKNPSATLTAYSVSLTREALTDTSPTNVSAYQFSSDGVTFSDSLNLGDLAPSAISPVVYVRRTTPASAVLALWNVRFVASAASYAP